MENGVMLVTQEDLALMAQLDNLEVKVLWVRWVRLAHKAYEAVEALLVILDQPVLVDLLVPREPPVWPVLREIKVRPVLVDSPV